MSSNTPYRFEHLVDQHVEGGGTIALRPNTVAEWDQNSNTFYVSLYSTHICTLYSDGSVRLHPGDDRRNTTKNRLNDALIPLGWKIIGQQTWRLRTVEPPYRTMEFVDNMILTSITKKEENR